MKSSAQSQPPVWNALAWLTTALVGVVAPVLAMLALANAPVSAPLASVSALILALALMGIGMIGAAAAGRLLVGILLALVVGGGLMLLALGLGLPALAHPYATGLAILVASISFAARGFLFARSAGDRGWWIAGFVLSGEAAIVLTALAEPELWPDWLLVLLPAQWAYMAIQMSIAGNGILAAIWVLIALGGTGAATLLVARMWPRRWPYLVMFTTWLSLSALVYYHSGPEEHAAKAALGSSHLHVSQSV